MKKLFLALALLSSVFAFAQSGRQCGTMHNHDRLLASDPSYAARLNDIETHTNAFMSSHAEGSRAVVNIPVVVHVVYNTTTQNISDAQIQSQIAILNNDFRKLNADASLIPSIFTSVAADCEINFCLAQRTPSGAATTGIVRVSTTATSFVDDDRVKSSSTGGSNAWDATQYLNIWVCNLGGGLLGYAQFPGGAASTDGVVCTYTAFGNIGTAAAPFNKGRTATHEVGHWLNLRHIWGDATCGSDLVSDTPPHNTANYGCPTYPHLSTCSGTPTEMTMNYMDYTDDACMYMYTAGQKTRMQALFGVGGSRASIASSLGCTPPTGGTCGTPSGLAASAITASTATLSWAAVSGATSYNVQVKLSTSTTWTTLTSATNSINISGLAASSTYNYQVQAVCASTGAYSAASSFTTTATTTTCGTPSGLAASAITASTATLSWAAVSGATSYNVQVKLSTSTTWTTLSSATSSINISGLAASSTYNYQVQAVCAITGAYSAASSFTTTAATTTCGTDTYEPNNTISTYKTLAVNSLKTAKICPAGDIDWYRFTTTSTSRNFKIDLTTLPFDYDLFVYNSSGTLIGSSELGGTSSETFKLNGGAVGYYYVQVNGYAGAFSPTSNYSIRVTRSNSTLRGTEEGEEIAVLDEAFDGVLLFPNPSSNQVVVNYFATLSKDDVQLRIIDMTGKTVHSSSFSAAEGLNQVELNTNEYMNGMYMVIVQDGDKTYTSKLQVQH